MKKYKYLNYVPKPINLNHNLFDFVDDDEFCKKDNRIPMLIVTQFGIFPSGNYSEKNDFGLLSGIENQVIAFVKRGYLSDREDKNIITVFVNTSLIDALKKNRNRSDFFLWNYFKGKHRIK